MNTHDFRSGTERRHAIERQRIVAAARMGGITDTADAESHYWQKRENIWWKRLGALICAISGALTIWIIYGLIMIVAGVW